MTSKCPRENKAHKINLKPKMSCLYVCVLPSRTKHLDNVLLLSASAPLHNTVWEGVDVCDHLGKATWACRVSPGGGGADGPGIYCPPMTTAHTHKPSMFSGRKLHLVKISMCSKVTKLSLCLHAQSFYQYQLPNNVCKRQYSTESKIGLRKSPDYR